MKKKDKDNRKNPQWTKNWLPAEYQGLKDKSILVINDFMNAMNLAKDNEVVFLTADEMCACLFESAVVGNHCFGLNDTVKLVDEWTVDCVEKALNKYRMFDITIMNPPWGQIGWSICYEAWQKTRGPVVCLNSANVLHTITRFDEKSYFQDYKPMFGCLENETVLTHADVMRMFPPPDKKEKKHGVVSTTSVSIATFGHEYAEPQMNRFEHLCIDWIKSNPADYQNDILSDWAVYISKVSQNAHDYQVLRTRMIVVKNEGGEMRCCYDRFLVPPKQKPKQIDGKVWWACYQKCQNTKMQPAVTAGLRFDTFEEAKNFVDSQDTKFMRFVNKIVLTDVNISQNNLFVMRDYKKPWTDERFYQFFNLTPGEIVEIEKM